MLWKQRQLSECRVAHVLYNDPVCSGSSVLTTCRCCVAVLCCGLILLAKVMCCVLRVIVLL